MQSSIKYRPKTFIEVIGQRKTTSLLKELYDKGKFPQALLLSGAKGAGKTTIAMIVAISLQCTHLEFGNPCKVCRANAKNFPIFDINCGDQSSVNDVRDFIASSQYEIIGKGKKKVYIFDEAHRLTGHAQDAALKFFEAKGNKVCIICSTRPDKIIETLRSRCQNFALSPFKRKDIEALVRILLDKAKSKLSVGDLADALSDAGVTSGRLIANAVDKYVSGATAEDAADVEGASMLESKHLIRTLVKGGNWAEVADILKKTNTGDVRLLRSSVINYLRTVLLESPEIDKRADNIAKAITRLAYVNQAEDSTQLAALSAELYTLCTMFKDYSL